MINYGAILYDLLSNSIAIQQSAIEGRIYPVVVPQMAENKMPAISYTKKIMPYMCKGPTVMDEVEFKIYILDDHADDLDELCQTVRGAIDNVGRVTTAEYTLGQCNFIEQDHEKYDHELQKYYIVLTYQMQIKKI